MSARGARDGNPAACSSHNAPGESPAQAEVEGAGQHGASPLLDAWGRPRSSRSVPTGPGSRGGTSHLAEYHRAYRRAHPAVGAQQRARRRQRALARDAALHEPVLLSTALLALVERRAAELGTLAAAARELGVARTSLARWRAGTYQPRAWVLDAIVATYGWEAVRREAARLRRIAK